MVAGELDGGTGELEWQMLKYCGLAKQVAGGGANNGEDGGKLLAGYLVEEAEVKMEASDRINFFCGKNWVTEQARYLGNKTGMERVGEFGKRLGQISVYTKFGNLQNTLMLGISKALMDELSRYFVVHNNYGWGKKAVWTRRV